VLLVGTCCKVYAIQVNGSNTDRSWQKDEDPGRRIDRITVEGGDGFSKVSGIVFLTRNSKLKILLPEIGGDNFKN